MPNTSATDTSKLMDVEKSTELRSWSDTFSRSQCSSTTTEAWRIITPLGSPVEPEVKMTCDRFCGRTPRPRRRVGPGRQGVAEGVERERTHARRSMP